MFLVLIPLVFSLMKIRPWRFYFPKAFTWSCCVTRCMQSLFICGILRFTKRVFFIVIIIHTNVYISNMPCCLRSPLSKVINRERKDEVTIDVYIYKTYFIWKLKVVNLLRDGTVEYYIWHATQQIIATSQHLNYIVPHK